MGCITAIESYSNEQVEVSKIAKAIAHPARIAILELLYNRSYTVNDIVSELPLAQSTVSQHLKELKKARLVDVFEVPPKAIYTLNKKRYMQTKVALNKFFSIS